MNGFTLGSFTGYFRQRESKKNITFPYEEYSGHFILGTIYSRVDGTIDERRVYTIDDLQSIVSVIGDFTFLLQEKWRIAGERPGSGNTRNIGSIRSIRGLVDGNGPFAPHGPDVFDDYWMNYLTPDMARAIDRRRSRIGTSTSTGNGVTGFRGPSHLCRTFLRLGSEWRLIALECAGSTRHNTGSHDATILAWKSAVNEVCSGSC